MAHRNTNNQSTGLCVKEETTTVTKPVTYDGKALNDAIEVLLLFPLALTLLFILGAIAAGMFDHFLLFGAAIVLSGICFTIFLHYLKLWEGKDEQEVTVTRSYVELPGVRRGRK